MKISLQILSKNAQLETVEDLSTLGFYYICICKCRAEQAKEQHSMVVEAVVESKLVTKNVVGKSSW